MRDFVHLHVHTEYSLLDGANRIKDLIKRIAELGMKSIAITDHGVMFGVVDFYKTAIENGIKPILGCEVYTAMRSRLDKQPGLDSEYGHLVLLAKNMTGYKNLMKLVSLGFTEGFYYKPRIDMELLEKYSEGLIAMSACLSGEIPRAFLDNNVEKAKNIAIKYDSLFGRGNFYLELQKNGIEEQNLVNQQIIKLSRETGIPLVATNDAHYLKREDARAHDILLCIQTGKTINDDDRMKFSNDEFYIKTQDEMQSLFENVPEALENTCKIADMCNVSLEFGKYHLPEFNVPDQYEPFEYLSRLCLEGLAKRYGAEADTLIKDRLSYELSIIKQMGFVDYFLIVWDFIRYAKAHEIIVGPGRGSAAGSIVSYCLEITNIDPIKFNLIFERFLNPERISMPDIDIDFCDTKRQEVIDYVVEKYGKDKVAQIITFGTMAAKGAIRDVGRALDIPYSEVDQIAKMIPFQNGINIEKALEMNPELKNRYDNDLVIKDLIDTARLLEGMPRNASTHASGVVVSKEPIMEHVPLSKNGESITTQFTMGLLEELGLLKMDFLGLRTLTVISEAVKLIKINHGVSIEIEKIPIGDTSIFKLISDGKTSGIFQLESAGILQFMKELQPSSLEDIIAGISLYRPGPMEQIPKYIRNKNNPSEVKYSHPLLEKILNVTYGCMVYQEQVMQIFRDLAGYSMARSDLVRKAMSKKKHSVMVQERQNFVYGSTDENGNIVIPGAIRNGVSADIANKLYDSMMDFASYAFNKSHAAAYAIITYQTAWLKTFYPVEFMAALLNSFLDSSGKISGYVHDCELMGIEVLPPDINESDVIFSVTDKQIRFGLAAIKNVGGGAVIAIIEERIKNGRYSDFRNFCERTDGANVNKRCVESLIKSGAFDSMKVYRSKLIAVFEKLIDGIQRTKKRNMEGQLSLFDIGETKTTNFEDENYPDINEYPAKILLAMEKEMLGFYISGHPLDEFEDVIESEVTFFSTNLNNTSEAEADEERTEVEGLMVNDGLQVVIGGIITQKKTKTTKNNNLMAFLTIEDLYGTIEVIVFPTIMERYAKLISEENIVLISGRVSVKEDEDSKIICEEIRPMKKGKIGKLYIRVNGDYNSEPDKSFLSLLKYFSGSTPVVIYNENDKSKKTLEKNYWVNINECLLEELKIRLGNDNIKVV